MQRTVDVNGVNDIVEVVNLLHKMMYISILNYQHFYLNENRYFRDLFFEDRLIFDDMSNEYYDFILGSDFESVLELVMAAIAKNSNCIFITTYQERSSARSLVPHLERYGLSAETVDLHTFLHPCHLFARDEMILEQIDGSAKDLLLTVEMSLPSPNVDLTSATIEESAPSNLQIFRDIYLIRISFNSPSSASA